MKLYVLIPVYKRSHIFEKVMIRLNQIREKSNHEILLVVVGDLKDDCKKVYDKHKKEADEFVVFPNLLVSNKFNAMYKHIEGKEFDYAICTGSDDIISDYGWKLLEDKMSEMFYHFIGFTDLNLYCTKTKRVGYFATKKSSFNKTIGCYRALHKNLIKSLNYKPFDDGKNSGIDFTMEQKMQYMEGLKECKLQVGNAGHIVDLKSDTNINSYNYLEKIFNLADVKKFPQEIKELL